MMPSFEARISELDLELPQPPQSVANYVATYASDSLLFISGQLCMGVDGKLVATGSVGDGVSLEDGARAAGAAAINILAQARATLASLDRVKQIVRLGGFIAAPASFADHAAS